MSKNVLVIERDFETSRQIAKALEGEGYFVFTASGAEAGLVMARRVKPSLLFLNLEMRDAGGAEFLKKLRALDFLHNVPILLLTGKQEEYDARYADVYGIVNFVSVPLNETEIIAKSRASLEQIPARGPEVKNPPVKGNPVFPDLGKAPGHGMGEDIATGGILGGGQADASEEGGPLQTGESTKSENLIVRIDNEAAAGPGTGNFLADSVLDEGSVHENRGQVGNEKEKNATEVAGEQKETSAGGSLKEEPLLFKKEDEGEEKKGKAQEQMQGPFKEALAGAEDLMPDERKGGMESIMPAAFDGEKKKKGLVSKGFLWMLGIVLLGAASSFFFFMYIAPKPGAGIGRAATQSPAENQPVIVEQNTPAVALAASGANMNTPQQQNAPKSKGIDNGKATGHALAQPAASGKAALASKGGPAAAPSKAGAAKPFVQGRALAQNQPIAQKKSRDAGVLPSARQAKAKKTKKTKKAKNTAAAARLRSKKKKSAGYWALLEQEEAQLKGQGSKSGKTGREKQKTAQRPEVKGRGKRLAAGHRFYSLQAGAFASRANARKLTARLDSEGLRARVLEARVAGKTMYKVLVGRFSTPSGDAAAASRLLKDGLKPFRRYE